MDHRLEELKATVARKTNTADLTSEVQQIDNVMDQLTNELVALRTGTSRTATMCVCTERFVVCVLEGGGEIAWPRGQDRVR